MARSPILPLALLLPACAGSPPAPATKPVPPVDCATYSEGFGSFPDKYASHGYPEGPSARELFAYLKARPRPTAADRAKLDEERARLASPPEKLEDQIAYFTELGELSRECALDKISGGFETLATYADAFRFSPAEKADLRNEILRYVRDDDRDHVSLVSVLGRAVLADTAARAGILRTTPETEAKLSELAREGLLKTKGIGLRNFSRTPKPGHEMAGFFSAARESERLAEEYRSRLDALLPSR
ncbi:MAG: hypothetical protein JST04_03730 [Bdellovibrionales bacterium]|nr:hypothetical protein [Bdellovibrionales bacterium]